MWLSRQILKASRTAANILRGGAPRAVPDFGPGDLDRLAFLKDFSIGTVIDVGAHVGEFARAMRSLFPDANIHSFEPQASCLQTLREIPGIRVFPCALGDAEGMLHFEENAFTACSSLLPMTRAAKSAFPYASFTKRIVEVPVRRLDDALEGIALRPDILLKIDTQGYEDRVLRGAPRTLNAARWLLIEASHETLYEGQILAADLRRLIEQSGFRYVRTCRIMRHLLSRKIVQEDLLFERMA